MSSAAGPIGWVGLGMMGWPMAKRLVDAGYPLRVHDLDTARAQRFASEVGGEAVRHLAALGRECAIVVTMVPDSAAVRAAALGSGGLAEGLRAGSLLVDMTSGLPSATVAIGDSLAANGVAMVDAPVSGGVRRAVAGELAIMAGGEAGAIDRAQPLLDRLGRVTYRTGALGTGQAMKALNNLCSAAGLAIVGEALLVGARCGLAADTMIDVLNASTGRNNSTETKFKPFVLSRSFAGGFAIKLMAKDLSIARTLAEEAGCDAALTRRTTELWQAAADALEPGADHTAYVRWLEAAGERTQAVRSNS